MALCSRETRGHRAVEGPVGRAIGGKNSLYRQAEVWTCMNTGKFSICKLSAQEMRCGVSWHGASCAGEGKRGGNWKLHTPIVMARAGHGHPLQDSCLENPMDRGAWRAAVHGVTESDTAEWLSTYPRLSVPTLTLWIGYQWQCPTHLCHRAMHPKLGQAESFLTGFPKFYILFSL